MKKFLFLLVMLVCLVGTASAEIIEKQRHKDWESFILTFNGGTCARMSTFSDNVLLVIDLFPKSDVAPYGFYQVKMINIPSTKERSQWEMVLPMSLDGKLRVDARNIYPVRFDFSLEGNAIFINMLGQFNELLIQEAKRGLKLYLRVDSPFQNKPPVFMNFSLMGFTAAYNRCMSLMPLLERMNAPAPTPAPQKDPFADFGKVPAPQKTEPVAPSAPTPQYDDIPRPEYKDAKIVFM